MNDDTLDLSRIEETLPQDVKQQNSKLKRGYTFEHILKEFDKIDENETLVAARKPHKKKNSQVVKLPLAGLEESNQDNDHQPNNEGQREEVYSKPKRKTRIVSKTPRHQAPDHFPDPSFDGPAKKTSGHESLYQKRRENPESKLTFSSKVKQREEEDAEEFTQHPKMIQKKSLLQLNVRSNSNQEEYKASPHNSLLPRISHTSRPQGWDSDNNQHPIYSPKVLTESSQHPEDYVEYPRLKNNKSNTVRLHLPALSQDSTPRRLIALETPKKSRISNAYFGVETQEDQNPVRRPLILFTESSLRKTEEDLHSFEKYSTPQNKRSLLLNQGFPSAFSNMGSDFVLKTQVERNRKDAEQLSQNSPKSARSVNWTTPNGVSSNPANDHRNYRQIGKVEDGVSLFKKIAVSELVKPKYHGS